MAAKRLPSLLVVLKHLGGLELRASLSPLLQNDGDACPLARMLMQRKFFQGPVPSRAFARLPRTWFSQNAARALSLGGGHAGAEARPKEGLTDKKLRPRMRGRQPTSTNSQMPVQVKASTRGPHPQEAPSDSMQSQRAIMSHDMDLAILLVKLYISRRA
jgi:hypothetical protein